MKTDKKKPTKSKGRQRGKVRGGHPSLQDGSPEGNRVERMTSGDLQFIAQALTSGKVIAPTPFEELDREHPALWRRAQQVFGSPDAAREWLETRSRIFGGRSALVTAMRVGGENEVLSELNRQSQKFATSGTQKQLKRRSGCARRSKRGENAE